MNMARETGGIFSLERKRIVQEAKARVHESDSRIDVEDIRSRHNDFAAGFGDSSKLPDQVKLVFNMLDDFDTTDGIEAVIFIREVHFRVDLITGNLLILEMR